MPKPITLSAGYSDGVTVIPNTFFDEYLPRANGEFLKIYLYLLRWLSHPDHALSLSGIADIFFMTEIDVTRALKYWEAEGLLRLTFDRDGTIAGICLNAVTSISSQKDTPTAPPEQRRPTPAQSAVAAQTGTGITGTPVGTPPAVSMHPRSTQELHRFSESDDGAQLIFIIQQYLGRPEISLNIFLNTVSPMGIPICVISRKWLYPGLISISPLPMKPAPRAKLIRKPASLY